MIVWFVFECWFVFEFNGFKKQLLDLTALKRDILGRLNYSKLDYLCKWRGYMWRRLNVCFANPTIWNTEWQLWHFCREVWGGFGISAVFWVIFLRMACLLELPQSAESHESSGNSWWMFLLYCCEKQLWIHLDFFLQ